jgi:adenylylsulfate kinase-like enzyme
VCAILSIFPESRDWCRSNLSEYFEVFIDAPIEQVMERDAKGIYGRYKRGEIREVAGLDLPFPRPTHSDLTIPNGGSREALLEYAPILVELLD